jgi:hypothetical protein
MTGTWTTQTHCLGAYIRNRRKLARLSLRQLAERTEPVKLNETSGCWFYLCVLQGLDGRARLVDPHLGGQLRG